MGVAKRMRPPHMVASQLKILMPVGMAMTIVESVKNAFGPGPRPTVNIWCDHTLRLINPIATVASTIAG